MKQNYVIVIIVAITAIICSYIISFSHKDSTSVKNISDSTQSTFEHVRKTGILRCGYVVLPPEFAKDINTGKFSGISYDITNAIAKRLGLKVEWTEEVSFTTMTAALESKRFDAICFSLYRYSPHALVMDYTVPLFATPTYAFARIDDNRFDSDVLTAANKNKEITIVTIDGEASQYIAEDDFPEVKTYSLPNLTNLTEMMVAVETKKADIALANAAVAMPYLKANPGKLKIINPKNPLRLYSHGLVIRKRETDLLNSLNVAITEMIENGEMDHILDKWHKIPGMIYRVQLPYNKETFDLNKITTE
ncbi:MAG: transporter substrate-binding domain-containing protein [Pseudomonadota bacterium]